MGLREGIAFLLWVFITAALVTTFFVCGDSSQKCAGTWLHGANKDNFRVIQHEHGDNADRDCFDFKTWNQTAFGDTALSMSSFYFILPVAYLSLTTSALTASTMFLGIVSFLFHATYGEVSRMYDILATRMIGLACAIDVAMLVFNEKRTIGFSLYILTCKKSVLLVLGYVAWFQWRILTADWHKRLLNMPEFKSTEVTVYYNLVPLLFLLYPYWQRRKDIMQHLKSVFVAIVFLGAGVGCLIWSQSHASCSKLQLLSSHVFGHMLTGIGLAGVNALHFYVRRSSISEYSRVENKGVA